MRPLPGLLRALLTAAPLSLGCPGDITIDDDDDDDAGDDDAAGETFPEIELGDWAPCAWVPGQDGAAECATAALPMDYAEPDGDILEVLVKRLPGEPGAGQHWVLHGGPGGSALDEAYYMVFDLPDDFPERSFYAVDHRGIGGSGRLACPDQEAPGSDGGEAVTDAEWDDCVASLQAQWGDALDHVTTTDSARDLATLIQHLRVDDEPVTVWGGSYGTYLAQRYLQVAPDQPTAVILEGISAPGQGFHEYDSSMDRAGQKLMGLCAATPSCAAHFDGDPWAVAEDTIRATDEGHCASLGTDSDFWRAFLGALLFYDKVRDLVPAVVFRLDRCSAGDVDAIVTLYYALYGSARAPGAPELPPWPGLAPRAGNDGQGFSYQLFNHVALSEMWDPAVAGSPAELLEQWRSYTMSTGLEATLAHSAELGWPTFPVDGYHGELAPYDGPLLMLEGGLDAATAPEHLDGVIAHYTGPTQIYALFPEGAHGVTWASPTEDGGDCAYELIAQVVGDPDTPPDTGCLDHLVGVQFDGYVEYNEYLLGTPDAWDD